MNIFKTSLYIYIFQDEKCRLMRNLSLTMVKPIHTSFRLSFKFQLLSVIPVYRKSKFNLIIGLRLIRKCLYQQPTFFRGHIEISKSKDTINVTIIIS